MVGHPVLGRRICIIGRSSCGKSTLADAMGRKYDLSIVHLDKLYHLPHGAFIPRPKDEFIALHEDAINGDAWVMEGGYTETMPQRFARADSIIQIEMNRFGALYRFIRRYYLNKTGKKPRIGQPDHVQEKFSWAMVWWIMRPKMLNASDRRKLRERDALLTQYADKVHIVRSFKEMERFL